MKITATIARILLGLIFLASGVSGFLIVNNPPPAPPGLAAQFQQVFFATRWVLFVDGVQAIAGVLLLVNRYVPLALLATIAIIYNMFVFHLTLMPIGLPAPIVLLVLWGLVASRHTRVLSPLLAADA